MRNKIFSLVFLLLMIAAAGARAQSLPNSIWSSPQSTTTEGRYRSNADDFIRPDTYTGVKFNKWFGMVSFLSGANNNAVATAGFAAKVNNVYIGAFYNGNFWTNTPVNNYTEQQFAAAPNGGAAGKVYNVYNSINVTPSPVNNAAILIGAADMGFRVTYRTNYQSFDEGGIVTGNQLYNNYHAESGYMAPQIAWSMSKDLTKNGIRPYITVDLVFNRDYQKTETAGPDGSGVTGANVSRSLNRLEPSVSTGLGGYTFYNKEGFKASCDLGYVFTMYAYDNEYGYVDSGEYKTGKIKGTYNSAGNLYDEQSFMSHQLTPSLSGSWSEDKLALKFLLNLPLTIISREQNAMAINSSNQLVYQGASDSTFTFTFRPELRLAMQYKIIPSRLTLNTGARIQATAITLETTDRKNYNDGALVDGSAQKIHRDSFGGTFVSRFSIGPTFNFTDKLWVEAVTGVTNVYGNAGTIDIFVPGGLFSFGSVLVAIKF